MQREEIDNPHTEIADLGLIFVEKWRRLSIVIPRMILIIGPLGIWRLQNRKQLDRTDLQLLKLMEEALLNEGRMIAAEAMNPKAPDRGSCSFRFAEVSDTYSALKALMRAAYIYERKDWSKVPLWQRLASPDANPSPK